MASTTAQRTTRPGILARHPLARDALAVWGGQHILLIALVVLWQSIAGRLSPGFFFHVWTAWDGRLYATIARGGYTQLRQTAFYPLFPLLEHVLAPLAGGSAEGAGLIVANAAGLGVFALLWLLVERDMGQRVARRTLLFLALFPVGLFLACSYTESLFLLLALGTFLALRERRWLLAGALIALATLTRATGLALLLPFTVAAVEALSSRLSALSPRRRLRESAAVGLPALLPLATLVTWQMATSLRFGVPGAIGRAEALYWGRWLDWPWVGLFQSASMVTAHPPSIASMDLFFALLWLGIACAMLLPSAHALPRTYVAYTWALLILALATPVHVPGDSPLVSVSRYMLLAFPCFVRVAQASTHSRLLYYAMLAASSVGLVVLSWHLAQGAFIA
ncbi:MAG TPA: glycosyltransferase family 39 protein [Ktedonobacterales bacterium]|jgi:hypothetical protein